MQASLGEYKKQLKSLRGKKLMLRLQLEGGDTGNAALCIQVLDRCHHECAPVKFVARIEFSGFECSHKRVVLCLFAENFPRLQRPCDGASQDESAERGEIPHNQVSGFHDGAENKEPEVEKVKQCGSRPGLHTGHTIPPS